MNNYSTNNKLIVIAEKMLKDQIDLIKGCREILSLSNKTLNPMNEMFIPFRAIDSETDHLPLDEVRPRCSEAYLFKADKEKTDYLDEDTRSILKESCQKLIRELSK